MSQIQKWHSLVHRWFANKSCPGNWLYSRLGDLAAKVTSELSKTTSGGGTASTSQIYRVRKTWSDSKSQLGAYKLLANAKKKADENAGYKVFDASGNIVYPTAANPTQTPAANTSYKVRIDIHYNAKQAHLWLSLDTYSLSQNTRKLIWRRSQGYGNESSATLCVPYRYAYNLQRGAFWKLRRSHWSHEQKWNQVCYEMRSDIHRKDWWLDEPYTIWL